MNFSFDFSGRTALVTGGVSGIGGATSVAFKRAGAAVVATGLTNEEIESARADARFEGMEIRQLDVRDAGAVARLIGSLQRLDFLIHCGGMIRRDAEHLPEVFDDVVDVNLNGGMRVTTAARPLLARSKGAVVFLASVMSFMGGPRQPAYSASKGGIRSLTMSLAAAYAEDGIRVNAIAPGWTITNLSRGAREDPKRYAQIMERIPMKRWAEPAEMADPILFMCSDAARYMTGTVMPVDGGYMSLG